eukprot:gnl/Trimastix_PCT/2956.p1 GENE.gnl/Trimastix_PCT/2956~~gnl/Trimastix_PCT/2956.p1  ORF type:complete len:432 (-),score=67.05 gnl/Trimastix_PCT/2956:994-2289(-)
MENYENYGVIGEGTYGIVWKCRHKETGQWTAIKKFKESDEDEQVRKTALREIRILKQLKHPSIINLIEVFRRKGKLYLVFEFMEKTVLDDLEKHAHGLEMREVQKIMWQLLQGIEFCHMRNVIHRDIKPENLLISKYGVLKLCDFGFARMLSTNADAKYTDYVATRWYRAPELLVGDPQYGPPVDIWALGCLFIEMISGQPLFPGDTDIDQLFHIIRCSGPLPPRQLQLFQQNPLFIGMDIPEAPNVVPLASRFPRLDRDALSFVQACLAYEPEDRPSATELLRHPFFDGFREWYVPELQAAMEREASDNPTRRRRKKPKGPRGAIPEHTARRPTSKQSLRCDPSTHTAHTHAPHTHTEDSSAACSPPNTSHSLRAGGAAPGTSSSHVASVYGNKQTHVHGLGAGAGYAFHTHTHHGHTHPHTHHTPWTPV